MQYEYLQAQPYAYTSDELLLELHMLRNQIADEHREAEREQMFSKGQACMRSSDLPKKYGWGIHYDANGKMALYRVGSAEYAAFKSDPGLAHKKAMRSSRH